jgi:hypothetical protein
MRIALLAVCCLLLAPGLDHAAAPPPDFSGDWVASDQADDNTPAPKSPGDSAAHSHGGHGGGMGGGGGHGGMGGSHGDRGNRSASSSDSSAGAAANTAIMPRDHARALMIRASDDVFDIEANGRRMAYRYDGKHNYGPQYGGTVALTWAAPELVIETHPDGGGGSIEEHYTLSPDGKKLTLLLRTQHAIDDSVQETRRVFVRRDAK